MSLNFADLAEIVRAHGGGTYAFDAAARAAHEQAASHPDQALGLLLAAKAAGQIARRFDDQPVTAGQAATELTAFQALLARLDADAPPEARLAVLNEVAAALLAVERAEG